MMWKPCVIINMIFSTKIRADAAGVGLGLSPTISATGSIHHNISDEQGSCTSGTEIILPTDRE